MSDWWSKKLAGEKPTPPRTNLPPVQAPLAFPQRQPAPVATPVQNVEQELPQEGTLSDYLKSGQTRGGEATRRETATCPSCGGRYVFSRGSGLVGANPAPRCYECGWNGLYSQGDQSNWVSS